jgi:hypothetical protein
LPPQLWENLDISQNHHLPYAEEVNNTLLPASNTEKDKDFFLSK